MHCSKVAPFAVKITSIMIGNLSRIVHQRVPEWRWRNSLAVCHRADDDTSGFPPQGSGPNCQG
jgi:hypothetical protein